MNAHGPNDHDFSRGKGWVLFIDFIWKAKLFQFFLSSFSPLPPHFLYLRPVDYLGECLTPLGHDFRVGLICDRPKDKTQDFPSRSSVPSDRSKDSHCQGWVPRSRRRAMGRWVEQRFESRRSPGGLSMCACKDLKLLRRVKYVILTLGWFSFPASFGTKCYHISQAFMEHLTCDRCSWMYW